MAKFQEFGQFSREGKVSISADTEDSNVDFLVLVPVPELRLIYVDEDLHIQRQLIVELTEARMMTQYEALYNNLKNTVTEMFSTLTKISNNALPMYKLIDRDHTLTLNVGQMVGSVQPRKQHCNALLHLL